MSFQYFQYGHVRNFFKIFLETRVFDILTKVKHMLPNMISKLFLNFN